MALFGFKIGFERDLAIQDCTKLAIANLRSKQKRTQNGKSVIWALYFWTQNGMLVIWAFFFWTRNAIPVIWSFFWTRNAKSSVWGRGDFNTPEMNIRIFDTLEMNNRIVGAFEMNNRIVGAFEMKRSCTAVQLLLDLDLKVVRKAGELFHVNDHEKGVILRKRPWKRCYFT